MEWDEAQRLPEELRPKLAELGLMGVIFPEEYGGAGMGYIEYATIIEELARVDGSIGLSVAAHNSLCSNHIYMFGTRSKNRNTSCPSRRAKFRRMGFDRIRRGFGRFRNRTNAVRSNGGWLVTARKTLSRTRFPATRSSPSPSPTASAATKEFRRLSSTKRWKVFARTKRKINSVCELRKRLRSCLKTATCRKKIYWAI
jgi:hypothetical protein